MNEIPIPRYINSQHQVFFWEFDELIVFVSCMGIGIVAGGWMSLAGIVFGGFVVRVFRRFKNGALEGVLLHLCYWAGVMALNKHYKDVARLDYYM